MKKLNYFFILMFLFITSCGVKGAPMPRQNEMFIRRSELRKKPNEEQNVKSKNLGDNNKHNKKEQKND